MVELLGRAELPDAKDVLDEELESDNKSTGLEADSKQAEGSKKRRSVKEKKPQKNRKIPDDELERGFSQE